MRLPVIALPDKPVKSSGGPSRIGYEILKSFVKQEGSAIYLNFSTAELYRLSCQEELERVSGNSYSSPNPFRKKLVSQLARVSPWAEKWARSIRYQVIGYQNTLRARKLNANLFHIHGIGPTLAFSSFKRAQVIWSEHSKGSVIRELHMLHGEPPEGFLASTLKKAYVRLLNESSLITFPSWGAVQLFEEYTGWEVPRQRLSIVYNGVPDPLELYRKMADEKQTQEEYLEEGLVVTIAQHVPEKGLDLAFEALAKSEKPWRWLIVGEFTCWTERLKELIRQNEGSRVQVKFLGHLSHEQTLALVKRAHVVLFTQRVAVFDLSVLEAMALGKLIIATKVGGNVEALGDDYPLLGQNADDIAGLLEKVYDDLGIIKRIGHRNRARYLSRFTLDTMISAYKSLYKEVSGRERE